MKKIILIQLLLLGMFSVYAQNSTLIVKGTVVEVTDEALTMPGVSVYIKNKAGVGVATDVDGNFSLKVEKHDVLVFSFVGYKDFEYRALESISNLVVKLEVDTDILDEVVVTGLGSVQRKVTLTGAITTIDPEELQAPATNIANMIGGRVPGIITRQTSGEPGKNISEFWIRGIGTFGANSSALVLIDGLEGELSDIDPADIESFSVLKDASATAVYGVRGANGVVLVTTKRGATGKINFTARANVAISQLVNMPDYLGAYDYALLANEARVLSDMDPVYSQMELDLIKYNLDPDLYPNVNWRDEVVNDMSLQHTYYVSASGGSEVARYFVSLTGSFEGAAYKQDSDSKYKTKVGYNTYGYRSNLDFDISETTNVYLGLDGFLSQKNEPGMADTDYIWTAQAKLTPLLVPTQYSTGELPAFGDYDLYSPYVMLNHTGTSAERNFKNMVTVAVNQKLDVLTEGLSLRVQGALNTSNEFNEIRYVLPDLYRAMGRTTSGELQLIRSRNAQAANYISFSKFWRKYHLESSLNYSKVFNDDHRVGGLVYYYMSDEQSSGETTSMGGIPKRYQGISGRLTYGYQDTYLLDINFGYTGSENFQPGKQFGLFPSFSAGWVPTNYDFMSDNVPFLSFFKIRGSYGIVGNDRLTSTRFPYLTQVDENADAGWGSTAGGITETTIGADNLEWEKATKMNIGVDMRFLDNKLEVTADFFKDTRDGIFRQRTQVPDFVGALQMPFGNVGSMYSYGTDGHISYTHDFDNDMGFTVRANYTYSANEVVNWEQPHVEYEYQTLNGYPSGYQSGYISLGLFKDDYEVENSPAQFGTVRPGDIKYKDINGDGKIDSYDKVPLSNSNYPNLMYGMGFEYRWKQFTVSAMFQGRGETNIYRIGSNYNNGTHYNAGYYPFYESELGNVLTMVGDQNNRWTPASYSGDPSTENPNARFPRMSYGSNTNNTQLSTFWKDDARFIRFQELTFNYRLKSNRYFSAAGISSIDLQFVGYNLAVWGKIKNLDPEQAYANGSAYPIPRRFAFQAYIRF